jgi:hypothetical protein
MLSLKEHIRNKVESSGKQHHRQLLGVTSRTLGSDYAAIITDLDSIMDNPGYDDGSIG